MNSFRRFAAFLNIEPGEERLIGWLVLLYFVLSLGFVFVQSMAFGVFLAEYGVQGLPYSYITIAIVASLVAMVYIRLGTRVSFSKLLSINLIFLGAASLLIWLVLTSPFYHQAAFILPLWFQIVVNLGNLAVWPLAGSLFNFRQGKRLFPLLGSGNWLANIIGGFFIPTLVKTIGTTNLLLLAGLSIGASLFILRLIARNYLQPQKDAPQAQSSSRPARPAKTPTGIFKDRYVLLIFAYTVLWWVSFFFVDNIFYDRAFVQYPDAGQLTAFIGQLLSIIGIVALISTTILTSRIIARFGLRAGLAGMPLMVIVSIGVLAISGSLGVPLLIIFAVGTFAKLVNVAFGFSLSQSANAIVYQSLPETIRGRVQATAEGIVQPLAVGLAGITLLALTAGLKFTFVGLGYVLVGIGIAWLIVIFLLSRNYIHALTQAITKRRLGDSPTVLADPVSLALLRSRLQDPHPGIVIYAMNKLEALDGQVYLNELTNLIHHPAPDVRRQAFEQVEKLKLHTAVDQVRAQLSHETDPVVKESALRAFGAIANGSSHSLLTEALNETDARSQRGSLVGLLKNGNDPGAREKLENLLSSSKSADRILALQVLGQINQRQYYPQLITACDAPETSSAAGLAIASNGMDILPEIETTFAQPSGHNRRLVTLARALGRIGGTRAHNILLSKLSTSDGELRSQIFNALSQSGFHDKGNLAISREVKVEVEQAAWVCAAQLDLGEDDTTGLLRASLQQSFIQIRNRTLLLLSLLFEAESIRRVREAMVTGSATQHSYALEIMDIQLPADWKPWIMPLLEDLSPSQRNQRFSAFYPQASQPLEERLSMIRENANLSSWVHACAVYTSAQLAGNTHKGDPAMLSVVEKVLILKTVSIFSQTPDEVLADVANLLDEVDVGENETIFNKGEPGDSLYVIVDGKVRVHDGDRLLNYLGERDVFGEMALLDPEPRSASVTALEPARLFRLDQGPFYDLMAERPEVAMGIIHVLTSRLRNRVADIAELNARLQNLERKGRVE